MIRFKRGNRFSGILASGDLNALEGVGNRSDVECILRIWLEIIRLSDELTLKLWRIISNLEISTGCSGQSHISSNCERDGHSLSSALPPGNVRRALIFPQMRLLLLC